MARHGKWELRGHGGQHPWYCNMRAAHLVYACGIRHRGEDGPCQAERVYCPETRVYIADPDRISELERRFGYLGPVEP